MDWWLELILGILLVMIGSYLFTEGAEGVGSRFSLSSSFLGSVVSPLFTSMPEAIVLIVSLYQGARDVGIGTVFGEPFMVSTISYSLVAIPLFLARRASLSVQRRLIIPYLLVIGAYPSTLLASLGLHWLGASILLAAYIVFIALMRGAPMEPGEYGGHGSFLPKLIVSLILIPIGSHVLVNGVESTASVLGLGELALSLVLVPIATALPETMSSMIWAYKGQDTLAIGALIGEQAIFSTLYPALLLLTVGFNDGAVIEWSVAATVFSSLVMLPLVSRGKIPTPALLVGLAPYVAYLIIMLRL